MFEFIFATFALEAFILGIAAAMLLPLLLLALAAAALLL